MKKTILVLCFLLISSPVCAQSQSMEFIFNDVWNDADNALRGTISGNASMDNLTADNVQVNNILTVDNYIVMPEIPIFAISPQTDEMFIFVSDDAGTTTLFVSDDSGTVTNVLTGATGAPIDATYITQTANASLTAEQNLAALTTGIMFSTNATGIVSIAVADTDYQQPITWTDGLTYNAPNASASIISEEVAVISGDVISLIEVQGIISNEVGIISNDVGVLKSTQEIISYDIGIISDDILDLQSVQSIISYDIGIISNDVADLKEVQGIISNEVGIISTDVNALQSIQSIISYDVGIISTDINALATGVSSVAEGVAGPLVVTPTTGAVTVTIQSADAATAGYISPTNFNDWQNNRVSQDAVLNTLSVSGTQGTLAVSGDVATYSDLQVAGKISADAISFGNQPTIQFTILEPDVVPIDGGRGDRSCIVWTNDSQYTFTINKIEAFSDSNGYAFDLIKSSSLTDISLGNQTSVDAVSCDTAGTSIFTSSDTVITTSTIETGKHLIFRHDQQGASNVKVNLYGSF